MNFLEKLRPILETPEPPALGPGPRPGVRSVNELEALVGSLPIPPARRELVLAAVLLWHDHLAEAHAIVQEIESADGSYLHAIMHRREPDYGNAKYWFRRVGEHRCYGKLAGLVAARVRSEGRADLESDFLPGGRWDAFRFVDRCETAARRAGTDVPLLRDIQRIEFEVLFDHLGTV